jgi:hypothetical protein
VRNRYSVFSSADRTAAGGIPLPTSHSLSEEAAALRVKAAWYRQLAEMSCDQRVIGELSRYAVELETRAERLELCETGSE